MSVPLAAPTRLAPEEAAVVRAAIERVLSGNTWILGEAVTAFEEAFSAYTGHPHVVGVGNGTDALAVAFTALRLPEGSEVLLADNEGGYAATAARMVGLVPRVMDVGPCGHPDVETAQAAYDERVTAVVVTHLHGNPVPLDRLDTWRRDLGLALVEDCAQAHGLRVDGRHVGNVGDAATYSFYPTKNLGAVGDAGAVAFRSEEHAALAKQLRQYGWSPHFRASEPRGRNTRLDSLQAAVLSARLPFLDARNERRRAIAERYRAAVPIEGDPLTSVFHHAVTLCDERERLAAHLSARDIATAVHYPFLVSEMPGVAPLGGPTANAAAYRDRKLTLPCFPELRDDEVDEVCAALDDWAGR